MTKKDLSQYRSIVAELEEVNAAIKAAKIHETVRGSDTEFPYVKHTVSVSGAEDSDENVKLLIYRAQLEREKRRIEEFVNGIEDIELRRIFHYRYIGGREKMSWQRIAFKIGASDESTPRKKHNIFLASFRKFRK